MPSKSRQELINDVANKIFDEMVQEIQFDTVLRARLDAQKAQRQCSRSHPPGTSTTPQLTNSQPASSQTNGTAPKSISGPVGTATPTKDNPNIYLSCPVCKRSFASNRCAAHLATCMGISTGSRRGARNVKSKADERAASPYVDLPDDATLSGSQKSKSKKKDSNGNGKPLISLNTRYAYKEE
ncbi:hypothetical protein FS842_004086 [Serendipita sp. 407]|nr:hypothetical protein FS842_004086 [Serendipita sp. 407]